MSARTTAAYVFAFAGITSGCHSAARPATASAASPNAATAAPETSTREALRARTRLLVDDLARGDFADASTDFDSAMRAEATEERLAAAWTDVEAQMGTLIRIERIRIKDVRTTDKGSLTMAFARCRFERGEKVVKVVYDADDRVAGLFFIDPPPVTTSDAVPSR